MATKIIKVHIENGKIRASVNGIKGKECMNITKVFENLGKVVDDVKTAEYYENAPNEERIIING
jgi:hypothetical protein